MEIVGRLCDGCGDTVTEPGSADGCGSCNVVLCDACSQGTTRCPSCQRPFDETRELAPRVERKAVHTLDQGRRQTIAVAVTIVGAAIVTMLLGASIANGLVHLFVLSLLLLQLFRGRGWARWILVAIAALAAIGNAHQGFAHAGGRGMPAFVLAGAYGWCAIVLALGRSIDRYLRVQRARHP